MLVCSLSSYLRIEELSLSPQNFVQSRAKCGLIIAGGVEQTAGQQIAADENRLGAHHDAKQLAQ